MKKRILHLALAEGRGHLMRAHRLGRLLADDEIEFEIATTDGAGQRFLASLGTPSWVLPGAFCLPYGARHQLERGHLAARLAGYVASGAIANDRAAIDAREADLVLVDSFHPAMMVGPRDRAVFVHGDTMEAALLDELDRYAPPLSWWVRRTLSTCAGVVHHSAVAQVGSFSKDGTTRLPPLLESVVGIPRSSQRPLACVYLNPHHRDPAIAIAIERALQPRFELHLVGEGYVDRPGWLASDPRLQEQIAHASLWISGGGMAAVGEALRSRAHFVALEGDQPEQQRNLDRAAATMGMRLTRLPLNGSAARLEEQLRALADSTPTLPASQRADDPSPQAWRNTVLRHLAVNSSLVSLPSFATALAPQGVFA